MINDWEHKATKFLIKNQLIEKKESELYEYGFFILFSNILYLSITILIGLINHMILESLIFYVSFSMLRRYAGGFHAKTKTRCFIITTAALLVSINLIYFYLHYNEDKNLFAIVLLLVFSLVIVIRAPLDTLEKPLFQTERKHFRRKSLIVLSTLLLISIVSYCLQINSLFAPCCVSIILEGVLLIAGKIKQQKVRKINCIE